MDNNLIFIGGIHGVGKGVICEKIVENSDLIHLTASHVLKWKEISDRNNKFVNNLEDTQERLVSNLKLILKKEERYLLDGHFCLLNIDKKPERIPFETFIKINPYKLIVIYEDPLIIKNRLEARDNRFYDEVLLKEFQNFEIEFAEEVSKKLDIELIKIKSTSINIAKIKQFIK